MNRRILVIDDDLIDRDIISRRLELRGYSVFAAVEGAQGLELARSNAPDLILLDLNLPELDGWEIARRLKAERLTRQVPVVALTAHAMASDRSDALQAGCDDFETKPVIFERLLAKMERLLSGESAAR